MSGPTHAVFNQAPPRVGINEYEAHRPLRDAVAAMGASADADRLNEIGRLVGSADYQAWAEQANTHEPELHTHDRYGHRIDEVEFHPAYHRLMGASMRAGLHAGPWEPGAPEHAHTSRAAAFLMVNQVEPGHCCPISMTYASLPSLRRQSELASVWEPRVIGREYRAELAADKPAVTLGMAMTEKQGGSDVRANTTLATARGDGSPGTEYGITGHKWFCSAPMSDAFLVLAKVGREASAPSCFLVPRMLPDGTRNGFLIQRLKDKLGNKSNASSEIELDDASGWLVGDAGRGVATIIEMVSRTRLDCVLGSAGGMRQGVTEALWHADHRSAFGARLVDHAAMAQVLADLAVEAEAATWTALRLARAHENDATAADRLLRRIATPVSKYWVCKRGPGHAYEAMECLGGNGYTEAFPLARRYREAPVLAIWEGSGNVVALDVLRSLGREPEAFEALWGEVGLARGDDRRFDAYLSETENDVRAAMAAPDPGAARHIAERLAISLQGSLLLRHAPPEVASAFLTARLNGGQLYGARPIGDVAAILRRHGSVA